MTDPALLARIPQVDSAPVPKRNWRRLAALKIEELSGLPVDGTQQDSAKEVNRIQRLLESANDVLHADGSLLTWWTGEQCDHTFRLLHAAEADAVALLPADRRSARMKEVLFDASGILDRRDPVLGLRPGDTSAEHKEDDSPANAREVIQRYRSAWDDRYVRSRTFRNRLIVLIAAATAGVAVLVVAAWRGLFTITSTAAGQPELPWPTGQSQLTYLAAPVAIATLGSIGGLIAGAGQVVRAGGVYNPFYLPIASLILKIQMGALCAMAGVLALLAGITPEIQVLSWAHIAVWSLVFGASQQLVTQMVDRRVNALVSSEPQATVLRK